MVGISPAPRRGSWLPVDRAEWYRGLLTRHRHTETHNNTWARSLIGAGPFVRCLTAGTISCQDVYRVKHQSWLRYIRFDLV